MKNAPDQSCPTSWQGFRDENHLAQFVHDNCPAVHIVRQWRCSTCGLLHYEGSLTRGAKQADRMASQDGLAALKALGESL